MSEQQYITQEEAARRLNVRRATLYYYMQALGVEKHKFPLDKHVYLTVADFERIKTAKEKAAERAKGDQGKENAA